MHFRFYFIDNHGRERYRAERAFEQPVEALREAQHIAERLVTDPAYLCDYENAHLRVESEDQSVLMRFSIKSLLDLQESRSARRA